MPSPMTQRMVREEQRPPFESKNTCQECGRVFDLLDPDDADEWFAGHDCEEND